MIIRADDTHILSLSLMLAEMYVELFEAETTLDMKVYVSCIVDHFNDARDTVYIDEAERGFFIVRDETEPMTPNLHRYNGIRVYIKSEHRKGRLLSEFYSKLFEDFPEGDILGSTETNSDHIAVLEKRHTRIANVYKLNREV